MKNRLPGIWPGVYHQAVPILADFLLFGKLTRDKKHVRQEPGILFANTVERCDVSIGYDQQVHRCRRALVSKGSHFVVLVNDGSRRLPGDYFAENTIISHFFGVSIIPDDPS